MGFRWSGVQIPPARPTRTPPPHTLAAPAAPSSTPRQQECSIPSSIPISNCFCIGWCTLVHVGVTWRRGRSTEKCPPERQPATVRRTPCSSVGEAAAYEREPRHCRSDRKRSRREGAREACFFRSCRPAGTFVGSRRAEATERRTVSHDLR